MTALADSVEFDVSQFLEAESRKDLLRFTTAGSVDDGKSTLIGRLLYDSRNVYEDHIRSIAKSTVNRSAGPIDLSLLTDGLRAEREQGITIDVAYRYFATPRRKFIIADTPGHEQYTRNMATGASTADLAIILIDARNGVQAQSRRHAYISALLGIPQLVIAVNKMDLVDFSADVFNAIRAEFAHVLGRLGVTGAWFVPVSALTGDQVVERSTRMPWFEGPSLLEYLETVAIQRRGADAPFRMPVQRVIRPNQDYRGYAGQSASGTLSAGELVTVYPSGRTVRVKSIDSFDGPIERATPGQSLTLTLEGETDVSRGDLLAGAGTLPTVSRAFEAHVVWMDERPLDPAKPYLLKHGTATVNARVTAIVHRVDMGTLENHPTATLPMNGIGLARIETARPIAFDPYHENRLTGSAILIDPETNATSGALMIVRPHSHESGPVTVEERAARYGHRGATLFVGERPTLAKLVERRLFDRGASVTVSTAPSPALEGAGLLVVVDGDYEPSTALAVDDETAADAVIAWLEANHILNAGGVVADGEGI